MNEYNIEYFYRNGNQFDVGNIDIETCFSPYQVDSVKRLEDHIQKTKNHEKVIITFIKRKG